MKYRQQFLELTGTIVDDTGVLDHDYTLWLESLLKDRDELIMALEKYIVHYEQTGMHFSEKAFNKGQKLRNKITELKAKNK